MIKKSKNNIKIATAVFDNEKISKCKERIICWGGFLAVVLIVLYGYFLHIAIASTADREYFENQIRESGSSISKLEYQYIELQNSVNLELANQLGLAKAQKEVFIEVSHDALSLASDNHAR